MRRSIITRTHVIVTGAALALTLGTFGPAQASEASDATATAAGQAVIDGTATPSQKALVASDPQLAATVPVTYEESDATIERVAVGSTTSAAAAAAACPSGTKYVVSAKKTITAKSTLGFTTFKYHHSVKYCESGTRFLAFVGRSQSFTDEDWVVNVGELVENTKSIRDGRGYSKVKRKVTITNYLGKDWIIYPYISGNFKPGDINWTGDPDNDF